MAKAKQKKFVDFRIAFQAATSYHHAVDRLLASLVDEERAGRDITVPCFMLMAFTCELYMKVAYAAENNGAAIDDEHQLNVLFSRLSESFRNAVRAGWEGTTADIREMFPDANLSLYANLRISRDAFEGFRYFHEGKTRDFMLCKLPNVLRQVLIATYPVLKAAPPLHGPSTPVEGPVKSATRIDAR